MRKFLAVMLLTMAMVFTSASYARNFPSVEIVGVNGVAVVQGFELMKSVLRHELEGVVIDWPAKIEDRFDPRYYGCYGPACDDDDITIEKMLQIYRPEFAPGYKIYINTVYLQDYNLLVRVIAHELTHHVLTLNGYSIAQQHHFMEKLDQLYARQLPRQLS